jgi:hypothetical protein
MRAQRSVHPLAYELIYVTDVICQKPIFSNYLLPLGKEVGGLSVEWIGPQLTVRNRMNVFDRSLSLPRAER